MNGASTTKPLENLFWLMAWTLEARLEGGRRFDRRADAIRKNGGVLP
ncbi:MAG: hypothetical protein ACKV22_37860 [Bryobacteraceae bacterium]